MRTLVSYLAERNWLTGETTPPREMNTTRHNSRDKQSPALARFLLLLRPTAATATLSVRSMRLDQRNVTRGTHMEVRQRRNTTEHGAL